MSAGDLYLQLKDFALVGNPRLIEARLLSRPRSRKARVLKKWRNKPGNVLVRPMTGLFFLKDQLTIVGHPATIAALREKIAASAITIGAVYPAR